MNLLAQLNIGVIEVTTKNKEIIQLLHDAEQRIFEMKLANNELLAKHTANSPISVLCIAGEGRFRAGENLEEEQNLTTGTLIYLEKGIPHEVLAVPDLRILVTKFA